MAEVDPNVPRSDEEPRLSLSESPQICDLLQAGDGQLAEQLVTGLMSEE